MQTPDLFFKVNEIKTITCFVWKANRKSYLFLSEIVDCRVISYEFWYVHKHVSCFSKKSMKDYLISAILLISVRHLNLADIIETFLRNLVYV